MIYEILAIIVLMSWREVGILCDRTSWRYEYFQKFFWQTDQDGMWKDLDFFHVSNGLTTLILCHLVWEYIYQFIGLIYIDVPLYWVTWMWIRNIFLHIIIPLPKYRRWFFLVPLIGKPLEKFFKFKING